MCYRGKKMNIIERQLQLCLNKIENGQWRMDLNSLAQKLLVRTFVITELKLHYSPRKIVAKTKCLHLLFDSRFTFLPQIKMLKNKCHKALNILIFVSSTDWSADSTFY